MGQCSFHWNSLQVNAPIKVNETVNVIGKVNVGGKVTVDENVGAKVKPTLLPLP
jgi:carbonic anhydrase/acetyltransferase-like protein (isoleucine patch superfamily)